MGAAISRLEEWQSWQYETAEELNALVDKGLADVAAGNLLSMDQVREELSKTKEEWLRERQSA